MDAWAQTIVARRTLPGGRGVTSEARKAVGVAREGGEGGSVAREAREGDVVFGRHPPLARHARLKTNTRLPHNGLQLSPGWCISLVCLLSMVEEECCLVELFGMLVWHD